MSVPISRHPAPTGFHVMVKPAGPACNLGCKYCFYLEKEKLYAGTNQFRMSAELLESFVRQYIQAQNFPVISFAWQGGEPTLMGLDFFRRVIELQQKYAPPGVRCANALQTNGVLLNDEWCRFLAENEFLIGLSLDGPRPLHDHYRLDRSGNGTFDRVMRALGLLQKHRVECNALTVVNRQNSRRPLDVYNFLKKHGVDFMQFIPLVERVGAETGCLAPPPRETEENAPVTRWSVQAGPWGEFLCAIFDEWVRNDVGRVYVQLFEVLLGCWAGYPASLCVFGETCGRAIVLEHNGDLYACDHYVYPKYNLGNILKTPLAQLADSPRQVKFGADKRDALPNCCRACEWRFACNGACPKHRFLKSPEGEDGLNYLCAGYKRFFTHAGPYLKQMAELLKAKRSPALIMSQLARKNRLG